MSNLKKELQQIKDSIYIMQMKQAEIEHLLMEDSGSFKEKFDIWSGSSLGQEESYYPRQDKYPFLHKYLGRMECDRHRAYDLFELMDEDLYYAFDATPAELAKYPRYTPDRIQLIKDTAAEIMEKNISSFICDW